MVVSRCCPRTEPALLLLHAANIPSGSGACWWADSHGCSFCQVLGLAFGRGVSAVGLHEFLVFQHAHPTILIPYHRIQLAIPEMTSLQLGQELMGLKSPSTCFCFPSSTVHFCFWFNVLKRAKRGSKFLYSAVCEAGNWHWS
eukprot:1140483-Pelagomonas_calceolata.AAC.2